MFKITLWSGLDEAPKGIGMFPLLWNSLLVGSVLRKSSSLLSSRCIYFTMWNKMPHPKRALSIPLSVSKQTGAGAPNWEQLWMTFPLTSQSPSLCFRIDLRSTFLYMVVVEAAQRVKCGLLEDLTSVFFSQLECSLLHFSSRPSQWC